MVEGGVGFFARGVVGLMGWGVGGGGVCGCRVGRLLKRRVSVLVLTLLSTSDRQLGYRVLSYRVSSPPLAMANVAPPFYNSLSLSLSLLNL